MWTNKENHTYFNKYNKEKSSFRRNKNINFKAQFSAFGVGTIHHILATSSGVLSSLYRIRRTRPLRHEGSLKIISAFYLYKFWHDFKRSVQMLAMVVLLTSDIISLSSRTITLRFFTIVASTFAIVLSGTDGFPKRCSLWMCVCPSLNSLHHLRACYMFIRFFPYISHNWEWMSFGVVFFAHEKRIIERNSHPASEAN